MRLGALGPAAPALVLSVFLLGAPGGAAHAAMVINEIMYNSRETPDVEYIEILNTGPLAVNLTGWYVLDADGTPGQTHKKCFLVGTLEPGQYRVIPGFTNLLTAKYPWVANLNPNQFDGPVLDVDWSLGNSNDDVRLFDPFNVLVDYVHFTDSAPWPTAADGSGPSLELHNPALDNGFPASWGASINTNYDGTPGEANSIYTADQAPLVENTVRDVPLPVSSDTVVVIARVTDDHGLSAVELHVDAGAGYLARPMYDDGAHGDAGIHDSIYGASIEPRANGTVVRYYVSATDTLSQTTSDPSAAPVEHYGYTVGYTPYQLIVNELLARNVSGIVDEAGQHEDWLEIKNREPFAINLGGMYLTDSPAQPRKWRIPDGTSIGAGQYLRFWIDSDVNQGPLHAGFKLNAGGGEAALCDTADHGNGRVHGLTYGISGADISFGFLPEDADAPEYLDPPTPGAWNGSSTPHSPICINEFLTSSASGGVDDWVELYNRGTLAVDIGGWHLSDELGVCRTPPENDYTFPVGTVIAPGGFLVVDELALGFGFDLLGGDLIMLTHSDCVTGQDYYDHGAQFPDVTQGRLPNGTASWRFFTTTVSQLALNYCPGGPAVLGVTPDLHFTSTIELAWGAVAEAQNYDVVKGSLSELRSSGGNFATAVTGCLENGSGDRSAWDAEMPAAGQGLFYLVRASTRSCANGTYDDGTVSQVGGRDDEVAGAAGSCP